MKNSSNSIFRKTLAGYGIFLICVVLAILIVGNALAGTFSNLISIVLQQETMKKIEIDNADEIDTEYYKNDYSSQKTLYDAEVEYATRVQAEGSVLLQNKGLPIAKSGKITLLGSSISKDAFLISGGGSGAIKSSQTPTLKELFESNGYKVNPSMWEYYTSGAGVSGRDTNTVGEPVTQSITEAQEYGDAAIVVIGRIGMEDSDVATTTTEDANRHMLELSQNEIDLIDLAIDTFGKGKVTVLLNTLNAIEVTPLTEREVSVVWIGAGGEQGLLAIPGVLNGTYNPSGRLVDTYVYDNFSSPAMVNFGDFNYANYDESFETSKYLIYQEGIYVGYKYYETRYEDKVLKTGNAGDYDYDSTVAYPFGYGLSYTSFEYMHYEVSRSDSELTVTLDVQNVGNADGKAVIEIYLQKPYRKESGVEVASVELVGFAKTDVIKKGESQNNIKINIPLEYLRSYDKNAYSESGGYIIAEGNYYLAFGTDAHDALNNILAAKGKSTADGMTNNGTKDFAYKFSLDSLDAQEYSDRYNMGANGERIKNELQDIDITTYDSSIVYLSRSDWTGTWPQAISLNANKQLISAMSEYYPNITDDGEDVRMPVTGAAQTYSLIDMRGLDYDHEAWDTLLDQLTVEDMRTLICNGAYGTPGISTISKDATLNKDGPAGISATIVGGKSTFGYPVETLIAATWNIRLAEEMGAFVGDDSLMAGVSGWHAPGLNTHRTPFSGRNFEYYSEDSLISGSFGAAVTKSAQNKGLCTYSKHFALNDEELNRHMVCVFSTEQAAREIYLRPFEMNVRDGGSMGVMVSMNRIGGSWTGAHKGLITEILHGEWGFVGCVLTDSSFIGNTQKGLYAGTDLWLSNGQGSFEDGWQNDAGVVTMMRNACHNILYVIANSNAMNGIAPGTVFVPVITAWQGLLLIADVILGIIGIYSIAAIVYFAFIKKTNNDKIQNCNK